jgi:type I restriction enzyme M protein
MADRRHRDLLDKDTDKIVNAYHAWKSGNEYEDIEGFCKTASIDKFREQDYVLTPGRYVGAAEAEEDDEPFENKLTRLANILENHFSESDRLQQLIRDNLKRVKVE